MSSFQTRQTPRENKKTRCRPVDLCSTCTTNDKHGEDTLGFAGPVRRKRENSAACARRMHVPATDLPLLLSGVRHSSPLSTGLPCRHSCLSIRTCTLYDTRNTIACTYIYARSLRWLTVHTPQWAGGHILTPWLNVELEVRTQP